jgi:hypothetical protein
MITYTYAWKKYLPLIKLYMKKSVAGLQVVKLDSIDFTKGAAKTKTSQSFKVTMERGRIVTISPSSLAKDLFEVLSEDEIGRMLIRENRYEISLNSSYELKIENKNPVDTEGKDESASPDRSNEN